MLLDACHVVLGIFLSLLYALEGGEVTLQVRRCAAVGCEPKLPAADQLLCRRRRGTAAGPLL